VLRSLIAAGFWALAVKPAEVKKPLPQLLTDQELVAFYEAVWQARNPKMTDPLVRSYRSVACLTPRSDVGAPGPLGHWRYFAEISGFARLRPSWSDKQIAPGSEWFIEIQSALANSKVAVLLVSPDFIASDFIYEHELGPLLKDAKQGGVRILWIPVRASSYKKNGAQGLPSCSRSCPTIGPHD
jgi:hypothetical protein